MLRELAKDVWMAMLGIPRDRVSRAVIVLGTRNLRTRYAAV
jgi:hypothetical protein